MSFLLSTADDAADYRGMVEATSIGFSELLDFGSIENTFAYHNGDKATLKAKHHLSQQPAEALLKSLIHAANVGWRFSRRWTTATA